MKCLVLVRFLPGGSIPPEELFVRVNAQWSWLETEENNDPKKNGPEGAVNTKSTKTAFCIADYESIEQLTTDLAIMPGAGIATVEVVAITEEVEHQQLFVDVLP
jgi:hypothetical protein